LAGRRPQGERLYESLERSSPGGQMLFRGRDARGDDRRRTCCGRSASTPTWCGASSCRSSYVRGQLPELGRALELRGGRAAARLEISYGICNPVIMMWSLVHELHDLRLLQLAALLPRSVGRNLVWVDGVISALIGLSLIVGLRLVAPLSRLVRTRTGLLDALGGAKRCSAVACGLLANFFVGVSLLPVIRLCRRVGLRAARLEQACLKRPHPVGPRATVLCSTQCSRAVAGGRADGLGLGRAHALHRTAWAWSG